MEEKTGLEHSANEPATAGAHSQATPETVNWNSAPMDMPAQLGRYRIKKRLGGGGMGAVYLVENTKLQREEALKVPHFESGNDPSIRERFLREAHAAARLDHPNLCPIYDADVIDGIYFLTMRLLPGKPLSAYTGRPHPPREALQITLTLAQALEHAHSKGVIHRDLKPSNVMLCPGTGPTVLDFGLAKQIHRPDQKLTQSGMAMGTPAYMPPEQVKGELHRIGPLSDVYSLGVILFELLTGRPPFQGTTAEVMGQILCVEAPPPSQLRPGLCPALDAVCVKAMAKATEDRYPSMKDFSEALQDGLRRLATGDARHPVKLRRSAMAVWLCLALLLGGGSIGALFLLFDGSRDQGSNYPGPKRADKHANDPEGKTTGGLGSERGAKEPDTALTNSVGMKLVRIPGGTFKMGSPKSEAGRDNNEEQHEVEVSAFHLGVHEVTQRQFREVMGYNPSYFSSNARGRDGVDYGATQPGGGNTKIPDGEDTEDYPVENVSWDEAKEFCEKLTAKEANKLSGPKYRLPTEAQWEYACRGGAPSYQVFHFGNSLSSRQANFDGSEPYGGAEKGVNLDRTCKVGSYEKNRFGLYDMHGNVWEWCLDYYDKDYGAKSSSPLKDPSGPPQGSQRALRGGGWALDGSRGCRSARRLKAEPSNRISNLGFRVALVPPGK
jgi:formylglycine-generating enzyme required for sulfatase activity